MTNEANLELADFATISTDGFGNVHKESNAGDMKIKICCVPFECASQREQRYGKGAWKDLRGRGPHSRVLLSSMPLQPLRQ